MSSWTREEKFHIYKQPYITRLSYKHSSPFLGRKANLEWMKINESTILEWLLRRKNALNHHYFHIYFHIYAHPCIIPCLSFFCNLLVHFVKVFKSFTTEVIKNIIGILSRFISWDGWLYMGPGRVRFQGEVEVSFDSRISCTWHVVSPYFRHLCLVLDGFR